MSVTVGYNPLTRAFSVVDADDEQVNRMMSRQQVELMLRFLVLAKDEQQTLAERIETLLRLDANDDERSKAAKLVLAGERGIYDA